MGLLTGDRNEHHHHLTINQPKATFADVAALRREAEEIVRRDLHAIATMPIDNVFQGAAYHYADRIMAREELYLVFKLNGSNFSARLPIDPRERLMDAARAAEALARAIAEEITKQLLASVKGG